MTNCEEAFSPHNKMIMDLLYALLISVNNMLTFEIS